MTAYVGRTRDEIRDALLSFWASQYTARGERLLTAPGSDPYLQAAALAVLLESLEAQAEQVERDILPDQASTDALNRHGYVDGVARRSGVVARHTVTVSGPVNTTINVAAGTRMVYADGTAYTVPTATSVVLSGLVGTLTVSSVEPGASVTRAIGDVLTFVATPTGLNSTGTVATIDQSGTGDESDADYAARIIARRRERPASGNRAEWQDWVEGYQGTTITRAYVYPLLEPPVSYPGAGVADTLGCVTVVAIGPAQGDSLVSTRIVPTDNGTTRTAGALLTRVAGYIEGTWSITGTNVAGDQLRPVTMREGDYSVEAISTASQNVVVQIVPNAANAFPWSGAVAIALSTLNTVVAVGDHTAINGKLALLLIGTSYYRGGYKSYTMPTGVYNGGTGNTTWTFSAAFADVPTGSIYPCPANWPAIQAAVFAHFDALGPGDTSPASRWPTEDTEARATLYRTGLAADIITSAGGVLSATVTTPGADVTPAAKTVVTLGTLLVTA